MLARAYAAVLRALAMCLLAVLVPSNILARADTVPLYGPLGRHSSDPTKVNVKLVHSVQKDRFVSLDLPRSAIILASEYLPSKYPVLPDQIEFSGYLEFAFAMPHGTPIGEAVLHRGAGRRSSLPVAMTKLRPDRVEVGVHVVGRGIKTAKLFSQFLEPMTGAEFHELPRFDGLRSVVNRDRRSGLESDDLVFFGRPKSDWFDVIVCSRRNKHATVFCHYLRRINDKVYLKASFVDFRYSGGRAFANQRMAMAVKKYCDYDDQCDLSISPVQRAVRNTRN